MSSGLYYEPRSLWSIANVASSLNPQRVELLRRHFYNGERHPITINRIALCGVNYLLTGAPVDVGGVAFNETSSIISRCRLKISSPQRFHWNSRAFVLDAAMAALPTAQPPVGLTPGDVGEVANYLPSSLWGQSMLKLDYPLIVPRRGAVEWALSAHTPFPAVGEEADPEDAQAVATMLYQQQGGMFAGSARQHVAPLFAYTGGFIPPNSEERWPYPPDGYGAGVAIPAAVASTNWWPPTSRFPAGGSVTNPNSFIAQEDSRDGSSMITDLRVAIDQRLYDQRLVENFGVTVRPSPLSLRTGTRIRTVGTGAQNWWWRPGAPLALVFDHITPALVLRLSEPITLPPQDQLDVEMEFPAVPDGESTVFHVGISFNGFATIEG